MASWEAEQRSRKQLKDGDLWSNPGGRRPVSNSSQAFVRRSEVFLSQCIKPCKVRLTGDSEPPVGANASVGRPSLRVGPMIE